MKVNPSREHRRNVLSAKRTIRKHRGLKRRQRPIDPLALQAIDGLPLAIETAAQHRIEIGVTRLGGRGDSVDSWHVTFYWLGISRNTPVLVASWYPSPATLHLAGQKLEAATVGKALAVILDAIVRPGTAATSIPSQLRDKPEPTRKGRARRIKPQRNVVGKAFERLPPARPSKDHGSDNPEWRQQPCPSPWISREELELRERLRRVTGRN
jgi:hypothetical protein